MTRDDVRQQFAYNKWANERMLASLQPLSPELYAKDLGSSFPSIGATTAHIAAAEWVWLCRWKGASPTSMPEWAREATRPAIEARFAELEAERSEYLAALRDADLSTLLPFTLFNGTHDAQPLVALFQHVVNHGTYHRGQVAAMLRQIGMTPASTDWIRWLRER